MVRDRRSGELFRWGTPVVAQLLAREKTRKGCSSIRGPGFLDLLVIRSGLQDAPGGERVRVVGSVGGCSGRRTKRPL